MNNYIYVEGFTVPDKNKPKKSEIMTISIQETTVPGSEEPTQVFPCSTEEPTEEPTHETTVSGSEEPTQVFSCPPEEPTEEPTEDPTEEPIQVDPITKLAPIASPTKRFHAESDDDNSTFDSA